MPDGIEEGWGITNDGENIIISDGTDKLYYVKPNLNITSIQITKVIQVKFTFCFVFFEKKKIKTQKIKIEFLFN